MCRVLRKMQFEETHAGVHMCSEEGTAGVQTVRGVGQIKDTNYSCVCLPIKRPWFSECGK